MRRGLDHREAACGGGEVCVRDLAHGAAVLDSDEGRAGEAVGFWGSAWWSGSMHQETLTRGRQCQALIRAGQMTASCSEATCGRTGVCVGR